MKTCCMIGKKLMSEEEAYFVAEKLRGEIIKAIQNGVTCFISSFEDDIDLIFADIIVELMIKHENITLEAAISHSKKFETINIYFQTLLNKCKVIGITSLVETKGCFQKRNRLMVDYSQMVIAFNDGSLETADIIYYAKSLNKKIILI